MVTGEIEVVRFFTERHAFKILALNLPVAVDSFGERRKINWACVATRVFKQKNFLVGVP